MDPNTSLEQQRSLITAIHEQESLEEPDQSEITSLLFKLAELTEALDGWISGGGFLPEHWKQTTKGK